MPLNNIPTLYVREEAGTYRVALADEVLDAAQAEIASRFVRKDKVCDPTAMKTFLVHHFARETVEVFVMILLDSQHQVLAVLDLFRGTIDACSVYPREVVRQALLHNAAAVIFSHAHPSGLAEPSSADRTLTDRLKQALATVDIRVLDHIVIGGTTNSSFAERGWI